MEFRQMRYFLVVAEEMHFHRAAERLHLSQPSLSLQIQNLEEELGTSLFERSNRRVRLTIAGERFLKKTRLVLRGVEEAVKEVKAVEEGMAGTICISFISTALVGILPRVLRSFIASVPEADLEFEESNPEEQIQNILRESTDIGFVHGTVDDPRLTSLVVQSDRLMVALPTGIATEGEVDLRSISNYTTILPVPFSGHGLSYYVRQAYELAGTRPQKEVHVKLLLAGLYLVAAGVGISIVPASFRSIRIRGVAYRPLAIEPPPVELQAVWRSNSDSKLLKRFLQLLHEEHETAH